MTVCVAFLFPNRVGTKTLQKATFQKIDWPGIFFSLTGSSLLVISLEQGGVRFSWRSLFIILMLIGSSLCFISFGAWEYVLTPREARMKMMPLFPTRLVSSRVVAATLGYIRILVAHVISALTLKRTVFFTGFPFVVTIMALPQRFQIVNGDTPESAGLHMLPLIGATALGAMLTGTITGRFNIAWHLLVFSNILMTIGCGLMSTLPVHKEIAKICYFYQLVLGCGFGLTMASSMVVIRTEVALKDNSKYLNIEFIRRLLTGVAVSLGAVTQMRQLGGVIGLAVTQAILNSDFKSQLAKFLPVEELKAVLLSTENIKSLSALHRAMTCHAYGNSANSQMRVVTAFAGAAILTSIFAWQKAPRDRKALEAERVALQKGQTAPVQLYTTFVASVEPSRSRILSDTTNDTELSLLQRGSLPEISAGSPIAIQLFRGVQFEN